MRPQLAACLAIVVVVAIAGCQSASGSPSATSPPTGGSVSPPGSDAVIDPAWITRPALTCGDPDRLFPPEALAGLGLAELGLDPAAQVLRSILAEDTDSQFPSSGWHRAIDDPKGVTFVAAGNEESPWFTVAVGVLNGTLQATEIGQCNLRIAAPGRVNFARWWLDPDAPPPTAASTRLSVLLRERECASGRPPEGRVLAPTIVTSAAAVLIAIGLREQLTAQDCPGNPAYALEVVLPAPLGSRALFDASQFPPRPVTTEDPG